MKIPLTTCWTVRACVLAIGVAAIVGAALSIEDTPELSAWLIVAALPGVLLWFHPAPRYALLWGLLIVGVALVIAVATWDIDIQIMRDVEPIYEKPKRTETERLIGKLAFVVFVGPLITAALGKIAGWLFPDPTRSA